MSVQETNFGPDHCAPTQMTNFSGDYRLSGLDLLSTVINSIGDSIYAKDLDGRYLAINTTGAAMLGYPADLILGKTDYDLVGSEARFWMEQDRLVMKTGEPLSYENSLIIDDRPRFFHTRKTPLIDGKGQIAGVIGISQEITRLREAESRYRYIFEYAPVALWEEDYSGVAGVLNVLRDSGVHNLEERIDSDPGLINRLVETITVTDVNREALRLSGLSAKPRSMADLRKVISQQSLELFKNQFVALFNGDLPYRTETSIDTPMGKRNVLFQLNVLPGHEENMGKVLISVVDVGTSKQTDPQINEMHELYNSVVEGQHEMICRIDHAGSIIFANSAFERFFGKKSGAFTTLFPEAQTDTVQAFLTNANNPGSGESWAYDSKGNYRWLEFDFSPLAIGNSKGQLVVLRDITLRKNAEEELAASEQRWRSVFSHAQDGIITLNSQGLILSANEAANRQMGQKLSGLRIFDVMPGTEHNEKIKAQMNRLFQTGESQVSEFVFENEGQPVYVSSTATPLWAGDKVVSATVIVRDVTWLRESEKRVREALVEGQDAERKRIARELHDGLGQVLTAVKMGIQEIRHTKGEGQEICAAEGMVDRCIAEIKGISRNLTPDILFRYGLKSAMEDVADKLFSSSSTELVLQFVESEKRYPPAIEISIFRIFQELLNNSLTHANAKTVNVQLIDHGASLVLMVEDDGQGYNASTVSTGIGLLNINTRAELLNGTVDVETGTGKGTLTTVEIPLP